MAAERDVLRPYTGKDLTVIAWLWARTVASPDPMMRGAHVPLASSFVLSSKKGKQAIIGPHYRPRKSHLPVRGEVERDRTWRVCAR